ncbi:MAG: nucleotidyltransferase domain-containing protein [Bdellovibrionota bacterium]
MQNEDLILNQIVQIIKKQLAPSKIYLFGSRARGDHSDHSDYDILIIVDEVTGRRSELIGNLHLSTFDVPASIDFLIYTQKEFDEWKTEFGAIPYECVQEGIELNV